MEIVTEHSLWMACLFWKNNVHVSWDYRLRMGERMLLPKRLSLFKIPQDAQNPDNHRKIFG
jgi:hypothetical protein